MLDASTRQPSTSPRCASCGAARPRSLDDASLDRVAASAAVGRAHRRRRRDRLRRQHRLRPARQHPHPRRAPGRAAAQPDPVAQRAGSATRCRATSSRLMIVLKLLGLGRGYSGVRPRGHRRAPGAARPRRHAAHPEPGQRRRIGRPRPARASDRRADGRRPHRRRRRRHARRAKRCKSSACEPLELGPKEGLALINGTQASTAIALDALFIGERVFGAAIAAGALSVDALKGRVKPFDPRISELRGQPGQIRVAAAIARLLDGSEILASHGRCGRVQDPYSFRCQPQVMGAEPRPAHQRRAHADHRGRRGDRQSDRVPG